MLLWLSHKMSLRKTELLESLFLDLRDSRLLRQSALRKIETAIDRCCDAERRLHPHWIGCWLNARGLTRSNPMLKATTIGLGGAASLTLGAATLILTPAVAGGA